MPWAPQHKEQTRYNILTSAARLFTHHGFDKVSIDQVMQQAGLTRGAFYKHFASKAELYAQAIRHGAHDRAGRYLREAVDLEDVINRYISCEHVNSEDDVCPLAFLVSDITQQEPLQQASYTRALQGFIALLAERSGQGEDRAILSGVLMIGGVALARAAGDSELANRILDVTRNEACIQLACKTSE